MVENPMIGGAIIGGVTSLIVILLMTKFRKPMNCPKCETELPKFRKPNSFRQMMWGGHTCPNCGAELDGRGRLREAK